MPSAPTGLRVVKVSPSSFTVSANASARHYRLFAAKTRHELATVRIKNAAKSKLRTTPKLTLKHLNYTTDQYFYRVEALNGKKHRFSAITGTVGLKPATPTNLHATGNLQGFSLTWDSGRATGFTVTQATNAAMTQGVKTYSIAHEDHQFSPPDLVPGTTYYFQVQALNGTTPSDKSTVASATCQTLMQPLRQMTFNILKAEGDGRIEGGNTVAPWSQRKAVIVEEIQRADPDVINIQEGMSWVGAPGTNRQVDDLVNALHGEYSLVRSEIPPAEPGTQRLGVYILYKASEYTTVGNGGHWNVGDDHYAAYQVLQNNESGAEYLDVSPHLEVALKGGTDQMRLDEDKSMYSQAMAFAQRMGNVPVVFGGDFNSDPSHGHEFNGPSDYNLSQGMADSFDVAQTRTNEQYNSANGYQTTPPALGLRIDYIFTSPGIATKSWGLMLNLSHGKWTGVIPSDHNAMVTDLEIPYQATS